MKFAYLIMAHHRFDVLQMLLSDLDSTNNDIFLHIDKKTKDFPIDDLQNCVKHSHLIFVKRIPVYWGHSSQIKCVLNLLREARKYSTYDYYHLLVGVEFPLMTQKCIHDFFNKNRGKEFIGFNAEQGFEERIRYYYIGSKYYRNRDSWIKRRMYDIGDYCLKFQKRIGVNRLKHDTEYYKKGYANWSITDGLAEFFVENAQKIMKEYKWTFCADEICFHTLVYHSPFFNNVYDYNDEYHSAMRITTWDDPYNQFHLCDVPMLVESNMLFARKFDDEEALETISEIIKSRKADEVLKS